MGTLWFWIVVLMLTAYVVLDGFDFGVGIVYLLVTRNESERSQALRSIGPVWDGNEVWLLAAAGTLFFAFPLLYASAFSGFYLPLMIVLWLIILRGISIELRGHSTEPLWRTFFEGVFCLASALLAIFFGAAMANVVRGVPIGADGYFFLPLWTNFRTGVHPGILDWYTVLGGVLSLVSLSLHGALYLALKTEGEIEERATAFAKWAWIGAAVLTSVSITATVIARPASLTNYTGHPIAFIFSVMVAGCLGVVRLGLSKRSELYSFLASAGYLSFMILGAAFGLFPVLLPSVGTEGSSITVDRALSGQHTLHVGLVWWTIGMLLALMYFIIGYWFFRGKVPTDEASYEH